MGQSRRGERSAGKSDPTDALAVARAALREGPETLPAAHLDEAALELKILLDHREDIVKARSAGQQRLRWHLHDLWPELELPAGCLDRPTWLDRLARKLACAEQSARVRVARELVVEIRRRARRAKELEGEIAALVSRRAPELLELKGCGTLIAAKLVAETAGAARLSSDAKFAHPLDILVADLSRLARARLVVQAVDALLGEAPPPLADRRGAAAQAGCDVLAGISVGGGQHDPTAQRQGLGTRRASSPSLEHLPASNRRG
jgi:hypothetical protein